MIKMIIFKCVSNTDILVNVDSTCIAHCPSFLLSHQIHGTPNTPFFMFFFQNWEEMVWSNLHPLNYVSLVFLVNPNLA